MERDTVIMERHNIIGLSIATDPMQSQSKSQQTELQLGRKIKFTIL